MCCQVGLVLKHLKHVPVVRVLVKFYWILTSGLLISREWNKLLVMLLIEVLILLIL